MILYLPNNIVWFQCTVFVYFLLFSIVSVFCILNKFYPQLAVPKGPQVGNGNIAVAIDIRMCSKNTGGNVHPWKPLSLCYVDRLWSFVLPNWVRTAAQCPWSGISSWFHSWECWPPWELLCSGSPAPVPLWSGHTHTDMSHTNNQGVNLSSDT